MSGAETITVVDETMPLPDARSLTIREFCELEGFSRTTFFKMQRNGTAPETLRIPGVSIVRITAAARREWHARMAALKDDARIEKQKNERTQICSRAGKVGVSRRQSKRRRAS